MIYAAIAVSVLVGIAIGVIERSPTSCSSRLMSQTGGTNDPSRSIRLRRGGS